MRSSKSHPFQMRKLRYKSHSSDVNWNANKALKNLLL